MAYLESSEFEAPLIRWDAYQPQMDVPVPAGIIENNWRDVDRICRRGELLTAVGAVLRSVPGRAFTTGELVEYAYPAEVACLQMTASQSERGQGLAKMRKGVASMLSRVIMAEHLLQYDFVHQRGNIQTRSMDRFLHRALPLDSEYPLGLWTIGDYEVEWQTPILPYSAT